jgi:peroxiredoxin Q/BCP
LSFLFFSVKGSKLKVGDIAPDFTLEDAFGNKYTLSSYRGKSPVVIYFYPKANTPGCTKQACGIRDEWSKFEQIGSSFWDKCGFKEIAKEVY